MNRAVGSRWIAAGRGRSETGPYAGVDARTKDGRVGDPPLREIGTAWVDWVLRGCGSLRQDQGRLAGDAGPAQHECGCSLPRQAQGRRTMNGE